MDQIRSIIVPTDFFELSQAATARAVTLARLDGASIHLVHERPHLVEVVFGLELWKGRSCNY